MITFKMRFLIICIGFIAISTPCIIQSCNKACNHPKVSFYYWRTNFKLSNPEKEALQYNHVTRLYIRYFDIELNKVHEAVPLSPISFSENPESFEIVPVVYIKNEIWVNGKNDPAQLAEKVFDYINQINKKRNISIKEIQIDCDWTLNSRDNFLQFIDDLKKNSGLEISTTIRLHQIKYPKKTGIPAANTATLMYYNMSVISSDHKNSVYDRETARRYIQSLYYYPVNLKLALPIFSWAVQSRDAAVINLCNKFHQNEIRNDSNFVHLEGNLWRVLHSNIKSGYYFKENDHLKFESVQSADLVEMVDDLKQNFKNKPTEIIFYDLDEFNLKHYDKNIFQKICHRF